MMLFHVINDGYKTWGSWEETLYAAATEEEVHAWAHRERQYLCEGKFTVKLIGFAVCGVEPGIIIDHWASE